MRSLLTAVVIGMVVAQVPIEANMLGELRKMAESWDAASSSTAAAAASSPALEAALISKLELLMQRLDRLEAVRAAMPRTRKPRPTPPQPRTFGVGLFS